MSAMLKRPVIESIGPPPEKHAARVAAAMARWLIESSFAHWDQMNRVLGAQGFSDGNPTAQRKLADRLGTAGGMAVLAMNLKTGKRGAYTITMLTWGGFAGDRVFEPGDPIPDKPWLGVTITKLASVGGGHNRHSVKERLWLLISHHAMGRLAERCGARTPEELLMAVRDMAFAIRIAQKDEEKVDAPPGGWRIPFGSGIAVVNLHDTLNVRTVITVLESGAM
jgi:hypothetical protein